MDASPLGDDRQLDLCVLDHADHVSGRHRARQLHHLAAEACPDFAPARSFAARRSVRRTGFYCGIPCGALCAPGSHSRILLFVSSYPDCPVHPLFRIDDLRHTLHGRDVSRGKPDVLEQVCDPRTKHREHLLGEYPRRHCGIAACRIRSHAHHRNRTYNSGRPVLQFRNGAGAADGIEIVRAYRPGGRADPSPGRDSLDEGTGLLAAGFDGSRDPGLLPTNRSAAGTYDQRAL